MRGTLPGLGPGDREDVFPDDDVPCLVFSPIPVASCVFWTPAFMKLKYCNVHSESDALDSDGLVFGIWKESGELGVLLTYLHSR